MSLAAVAGVLFLAWLGGAGLRGARLRRAAPFLGAADGSVRGGQGRKVSRSEGRGSLGHVGEWRTGKLPGGCCRHERACQTCEAKANISLSFIFHANC